MAGKEFPLIFADAGKKLLVAGFIGGFGMGQRLTEMGLTVGSQILVVEGSCHGPLVVDVRGSRLGLGCGVAHKIMVKEITDEKETICGNQRVAAGPSAKG
jgi:Fe2+ transport system protein FeoA